MGPYAPRDEWHDTHNSCFACVNELLIAMMPRLDSGGTGNKTFERVWQDSQGLAGRPCTLQRMLRAVFVKLQENAGWEGTSAGFVHRDKTGRGTKHHGHSPWQSWSARCSCCAGNWVWRSVPVDDQPLLWQLRWQPPMQLHSQPLLTPAQPELPTGLL